jgi:signal transduction histidine kinase
MANNKVISIAHFATKANFDSSTEKITIDLISYIEQYIESVKSYFDDIKIIFINNRKLELIKSIMPIEISVLLDNMFNNSIKARAKNFTITVDNESREHISLLFIDDGNGLDKSVINPNEIFEKGFTKTSGSGLGLYHVYDIVTNKLKGEIEILKLGNRGFGLKVVLNK